MTCICCGSKEFKPLFKSTALLVTRCNLCGTDYGEHLKEAFNTDYDQIWQNYGPEYLTALEATRKRQALSLYDTVSQLGLRISNLLDVGTGRGWFLKTMQGLGVAPLAGVDQSEIAIKGLQEVGIEAHSIKTFSSIGTLILSFKPQFISLMDVIEHVPPSEITSELKHLEQLLVKGGFLIVKVPRNQGFFYRLSFLLSKFNLPRFFHQLWQVGTTPPHFIYFSDLGFNLFLAKFGKIEKLIHDPDVEDDTLLSRVGLKGLPSAISHLLGFISIAAIKLLNLQDSQTAIVKKM